MRRSVLLLAVAFMGLSLLTWASAPPEPEGYADRICDTPQNLTGSVPIASGGTTSSLVWDGAAYGVSYVSGNSLYFARVAADGTRLAGPTLVVSGGVSGVPSLVWAESRFGIAWHDSRTGTRDIYFNLLSVEGSRQLSSDLAVTANASSSQNPSLTYASNQFGVVWEDDRDGNGEIYFCRISGGGSKFGSEVRLTTNTASSIEPSLVWSGTEYGVAWQDSRTTVWDVYFCRVSDLGTKQGSDVQITTDAANSFWPSLAWGGTQYGVAWTDNRSGHNDIYFARISAAGVKLGGDVAVVSGASTGSAPSLAWTGSEFGVAFEETKDGDYEIYLARVSSAGSVVGAATRLTADGRDSYQPALAFGTLGYGLAYFGAAGSINDLYFVGVGCHADTTAPSCPGGVSASDDGAQVTLTWVPALDRETEIAYHRIYRSGELLGLAAGSRYVDHPRPSGTPAYVVTAVDARGWESADCGSVSAPPAAGGCGTPWTSATTVTASDATPQPIGATSLVWDGVAYGVAWEDYRDGNAEIYFARVAADGSLLVPPTRITDDPGDSVAPTIAWTGAYYGLAWTDVQPTAVDIYYAAITPAGSLLTGITQITSDASTSGNPSLAWNGSEFGLVWDDTRSTSSDIYFARVTLLGVKLGGDVQISSSSGHEWRPSVAWDGSGFGLVWQYESSTILYSHLTATGYAAGVFLLVPGSTVSLPRIVWTGDHFGVTYENVSEQSVRLASFDQEVYRVTDVRVSPAWASAGFQDIAWTGGEFLVSWIQGSTWFDPAFVSALDPITLSPLHRALPADEGAKACIRTAAGGRGQGVVYRQQNSDYQYAIKFVALGCGEEDVTPPSCPAGLAETSRSPSTVTLGWGPSVDDESDLAYYTVTEDGVFAGTTTSTSWTDSTFGPGAGSVYTVSATNAAGLTSPACASVDTGDTAPPSCPENLLASGVTQTSATLNWLPAQDAKSGLRQYKVYRNDVFKANVVAGTTTYTDSTLSSNTTYNYAVRAEDYAGNYSTTCTTASVYISTAPITLFLTKNADTLNADLDWNDVSLNEYVVYRSTSAQTASELKRVPVDQTQDPVLQDDVRLWFYYIQQRE